MFDQHLVYASTLLIRVTPDNNSICISSPCQNGGTCFVDGELEDNLEYKKVFYCDCPVGYNGDLCEGEYNCLLLLQN